MIRHKMIIIHNHIWNCIFARTHVNELQPIVSLHGQQFHIYYILTQHVIHHPTAHSAHPFYPKHPCCTSNMHGHFYLLNISEFHHSLPFVQCAGCYEQQFLYHSLIEIFTVIAFLRAPHLLNNHNEFKVDIHPLLQMEKLKAPLALLMTFH